MPTKKRSVPMLRTCARTFILPLTLSLAACLSASGGAGGSGADLNLFNYKNDPDPNLGARLTYSGAALVPASGSLVLRDLETGTLWNLRGEAFSGTLAADKVRLRIVPAFTSFWFAWSTFNHDSDIWTSAGPIANGNTEAIATDSGCDVPCSEIISGGPPKDGIPSVDFDGLIGDLTMVTAGSSAANYLLDSDMVLGVVMRGSDGVPEARAYSHNVLWWHEIANDEFGGERFTVSFCPLTGSGLVFPGGDAGISFGTSGKLYNSNLIMYDRVSDSQWSQMLRTAITGPARGDYLEILPVLEMTWASWKQLWPDTLVSSTATGFSRDYSRYPYFSGGIDYRENQDSTFLPTNPDYDHRYGAKVMTLGVRSGSAARAYVFEELQKLGDRAVVNDLVGDLELAVVWDAASRAAIPFDRKSGDTVLTFETTTAP